MKKLSFTFFVSGLVYLASQLGAYAAQPTPWGLNFQEPATPAMQRLYEFHDLLLYIIFAIAIFVLLLLAYTIFRFRASANPNPSKTSHNTIIEIIWTVVPVIILIVIAIPSFKLLYLNEKLENPELTMKVTGYQWYWNFEFPKDEVSLDSIMIEEKDLKEGQVRLLSVDEPIYLPVQTTIQVLVTSADVLHSFSMPSFGVKEDAVPGRMNEAVVFINKEGTYYGQCAEICGVKHAYMPIEIRAVSKEKFAAWLESKK